jgi:hypothetical protein
MKLQEKAMLKLALVVTLALVCSAAKAEDINITDWFEQQADCTHAACCNNGDGARFDGGYVINPDGSVTLSSTGEHIQRCKVLTGHNPTGAPVLWRDTSREIVCFALGPGT